MRQVCTAIREFVVKNWQWFCSQVQAWVVYIKDRAKQLFLRFWRYLATYSVAALLLASVLTIIYAYTSDTALPTEKLLDLNTMSSMMFGWILLAAGVTVFVLFFIVLCILSFYPKGREHADRLFGFSKPTELEKLKSEVRGELEGINERLDKIESTLRELVGGTSHAETTAKGQGETVVKKKASSKTKAKEGEKGGRT